MNRILIVGAQQAEHFSADLLGFSCTTVFKVYSEWWSEEQHPLRVSPATGNASLTRGNQQKVAGSI